MVPRVKLRATILAPHHSDNDKRVLRSLAAVSSLYHQVDIFWDLSYQGHNRMVNANNKGTISHYLEGGHGCLLSCFLGKVPFVNELIEAVINSDLVYIHASAIEGLLYAKSVRQVNDCVKIIFDYHDSLPYELYYQMRKRKIDFLYPILWPIYRSHIGTYKQLIDGVVGISDNQLADLTKWLGRNVQSLVVPNVGTLHPSLLAGRDAPDKTLSFVWVGQVMRGRDLEKLAFSIRDLSLYHKLHVFGVVLDTAVEDTVRDILGNRVEFHGPFKDTTSLGENLPDKAVGVFWGWDDPVGTNINGITSPNKFYNYLDLIIPVIIDKKMINLAEILECYNAGIAIDGINEFVRAVEVVNQDYAFYCNGMKVLKQYYLEKDYIKDLREWLNAFCA